MVAEPPIGERISAYRRRRGLSQAALAGLVGRSESWLSQVERGIRSVDRLSVLLDLAKIAAAALNLDDLAEGLHSRRAQVHLDLAWAQAQRKRDAEAVLHLLDAERIAPEALRYNVIARETVREMLTRAKHGRTSALQSLATRAGVLE